VVQIADSAESVKETGLSQRAVELRLRAAFCRAFSANALFYDPLRAGDLPFAKVLQRLPPNRPRKRGSAPGVGPLSRRFACIRGLFFIRVHLRFAFAVLSRTTSSGLKT
jgi:hypothetical protein